VVKEEFAFTLGAEHKFLRYSTRTIGAQTDDNAADELIIENGRALFEKSSYYSAFANFKLDTYDDRYFPSRGLYFNGQMNFYALSSDFNNNFKQFAIAKGRFGTALPISNNLSLNLELESGFKLGDDDLYRTGDWFSVPNYSGYGVGYGLESFLGPIQAIYSWSPEGKTSNFFFSIGYWF